MRLIWTWTDRLLLPLLFGLMLWAGLRKDHAGGRASMIWSDAEGYYLYLPATFVYGSWQVWDGTTGLEMLSCCAVSESKLVKTRYTYGVAAMQMPFFLAAHAYASAFLGKGTQPPADYESQDPNPSTRGLYHRKYNPARGQATGFSDAYGLALVISAAFYATLGLGLVRTVLRRHFSNVVASATTVLLFFGTNLYYYTVYEGGMSHVYSFCLFAGFIWLLQRWMDRATWGLSLGLGAILALIFLIRPTNVIIALLLLLWEVYSLRDLRDRLPQWVKMWPHFLAMAGIALLLVLPQLLYWQHAFGERVVWSYEGEGFSNATHPKILPVLFSYQNGLFLYTPIMLLAVAGLVMGWRRRKVSAAGILLLFLTATYIFASWWAWWFGGAFGHRCYVEFYAVMALPLALVVQWIHEHPRKVVQWLGWTMLLGFIYLNLKMTTLYAPPWDGPDWTMERYVSVLKNVMKFWKW